MRDKSEDYGHAANNEDDSDLDIKQVNHNEPAPGNTARFPAGFISKYTERGTQETTEHAAEWGTGRRGLRQILPRTEKQPP